MLGNWKQLGRSYLAHTPFFLNELFESNCLIICFKRPRFGSSKSSLPARCFVMLTSMEPTCSKESSGKKQFVESARQLLKNSQQRQ